MRRESERVAPLDIPRLRLSNQRLSRPAFRTPCEVVHWLCAVQAQDYLAAKWALGSRMRRATDHMVEDAFNDFPVQPATRPLVGGEVTLVVELEDLIGKKKASYELPMVMHPTRSVPSGKPR